MYKAPEMARDAAASAVRGMHGQVDVLRLPEGYYARGVNLSVRGGVPATRPGFVRLPVLLPVGDVQGVALWPQDEGDLLVVAISGVLAVRRLDSDDGWDFATALTPAAPVLYMAPAARYLVVQDMVNTPVVLEYVDGVVTQYTGPKSIPVGATMIFSQGRLHVSPRLVPGTTDAGRPYLVSGNVLQPDLPNTVLAFTDTEYFGSGMAHALPVGAGNIMAMGAMRNASTGTGVGDVIVFGSHGVAAFASSVPRANWTTQSIMQMLFLDHGAVGPYALANLNSDMMFRARDGIRALSYTLAQSRGQAGALINSPLSSEVDVFLSPDAGSPYLEGSTLAAWDNQLFCTCSADAAGRFRGIAHLDAAAAVTLGQQESPPAWSGVWTGAPFRAVLRARIAGAPRLIAFSDLSGVWVLDPDARTDDGMRIRARYDTRALSGGSLADLKRLLYVDIHLTDVSVTTDVTVRVRPYGYPLWVSLGTREVPVADGSLPFAPAPLRFSVDRLHAMCDAATRRLLSCGRAFQVSVDFTGHARIDAVVAEMEPVGEEPRDGRAWDPVPVLPGPESGELLDDFAYSFQDT